VPKPILNSAGVVAGVRQSITATMAQHVRVNREVEMSALTDALDEAINHGRRTRSQVQAAVSRPRRTGCSCMRALPRRWLRRAHTNIVERSMRPQALTRKNALFAGHDDGAENWAILATLIKTAKLNRHRALSLARRYPNPLGQSLAQQSARRTSAWARIAARRQQQRAKRLN
jgi:hypothetical protein